MSVITNIVVNQVLENINLQDVGVLSYLTLNKRVTGSYVSEDTADFGSGWVVAPVGYQEVNQTNFDFYSNGSKIESGSIIGFYNGGSGSTLMIDPQLLGYGFELTDTIVAIGKFN